MSTHPPGLRIQLLGAFRVTLDGDAVTNFDADTARALLAYLALHAHSAHRRAALADLLWCDQPAENSLHNLRSALNRLRKALNDHDQAEQPLILAERQSIQWNPRCAIWVDKLEFEQLLGEVKQHVHRELTKCPWCMKRLTRLAELYQGEFLADIRVDSLAFEEWQQVEREHLHRMAIQIFHILGDYHFQSGAYAEAERYARRQIKLERWNEEAHYQLIQTLYASGQRSAALAQYEACRGILAAEFGVAPAPATTALYEEIRQANRQQRRQAMLAFGQVDAVWTARRQEFPNNLPLHQTTFVDRHAELDTLLHRLVNPANRLTTLIGGGGIGKTRLALLAGQMLVRGFAHGVWFVPLADLPASTEPRQAEALLVQQLWGVLAPETPTTGNGTQHLLDYLRHKELLLILDSVEHLIAGAPFLHKMLQSALNLTLLVTSRLPLNFLGEHLLSLSPLQPTAAVQLFVERVRVNCPDFAGTTEQLRLSAEICTHLHGNPLAIELAAAAVRQQSLLAILLMAKHGLGEFITTQGDLPERQRNLQALLPPAGPNAFTLPGHATSLPV